MSATTDMDVLEKVRQMQKRAVLSGHHGYSSVLAEAAKEIDNLRFQAMNAAGAALCAMGRAMDELDAEDDAPHV